jgi:predicted ATPase/DNA-binding CsgD family transcriptional regulator
LNVTFPRPGGPYPNNLPVPLTSFIGRTRELAEVLNLTSRTRLLTLTGTGGCGKSRLALQSASKALAEFPGGAWWVELAPISDAGLVAPVLAQAFDVRPQPGQSELEAVVSYLASRRALVVLDNCEHLLDEAARVAESLVRGCPQLRVIATSREPLRADGETEWRIPSLSLSEPARPGGSDAVRLFVDRAASVRPSFDLTPRNAEAVEAICQKLDGIPLAIELAAARLRAFSVEQIAHGLDDHLRLLAAGTRTALPRQQTMRASVEWSYELLSEDEQTMFRRLSVLTGGFTLEAADRICSGEGIASEHVLGLVAALVEKSLVQAEERGPADRYRLLETIRQYALERLDEAGETGRLLDRHRDYYLELAERIAPDLLTPRQPASLDLLDPEAANLSLAIERASATEPDEALRLVVALTLWWRQRSLFAQAEAGFARALGAATEPSALRARALWGRAFLLTFAGAFATALPAAQEALAAAEDAGDDSTTARALWLIAVVTMWSDPVGSRGDLERARALAVASDDDLGLMHATQGLGMSYALQDEHRRAGPFQEEALRLAERLGQQDALAWYWLAMALAAWVAGDYSAHRRGAERSLGVALHVGDVVTETAAVFGLALSEVESGQPQTALDRLRTVRERGLTKGSLFMVPPVDLGIAMAYAADGRLEDARSALETLSRGAGAMAYVLFRTYVLLAEVRRLLDEPRGARLAADEGLELANRSEDRPVVAEAQLVLGRLAAARGEWAEAQRLLHEALPVAVEYGSPRVPRVLEGLAQVAAGLESHREAARLLGAATRLWSELALRPWPHQRMETEALSVRVRRALGEGAFRQAFTEGGALTAEEAVAYVRRARGERRRPSAGWESLTPTELEVARHAASGLTNPEIAERMFISRLTVRTHLSHVFAKLGLKNRSELAREMARRDGPSEN